MPFKESLPSVDVDAIHQDLFRLLKQGSDPHSLEKLRQLCETLPKGHPNRESLIFCAQSAIELGATMRQNQQRERGLLAVSESATALTQLRSLSHVLEGIVRRGRQLLGSHMAWLAGLDRHANTTFVIAIDGVSTEPIQRMRVPISTGIAGRVIESGLPFWTSAYATDERMAHTPDIDRTISSEGVLSAAGVPLFVDESIVGVLIVGDRYSRTYLPWEIATLAALAAHAAVAMRNAQAFEETKIALQAAEDANRVLHRQTSEIEFAADAHERLTRLVVRGGGVQELASMVSEMLEGDVQILDESGFVGCIGAASGHVEQRGPERLLGQMGSAAVLGAMNESRACGHSVDVTDSSGASCRVSTFTGVAGMMGAVVVHTGEPLNANQVLVLERSALVLALILLSQERRSASTRDEVGYVLGALLSPYVSVGHDVFERARSIGFELTGSILLFVLEVEDVRVGYVSTKAKEALRSGSTLITELDGRVVGLMRSDDPVRLKGQLLALLGSLPHRAGYGVVARHDVGGEPLSSVYERLKRCLALLRSLCRDKSVVVDSELVPYALLFEKQRAEDMQMFLESTVGALVDHDARKGARLAETLLAYLDHGYGAKATAAALGIHVNTLMNRLEAADAFLGDWQRKNRGAEIHLALRLWALKKAVNPADSR